MQAPRNIVYIVRRPARWASLAVLLLFLLATALAAAACRTGSGGSALIAPESGAISLLDEPLPEASRPLVPTAGGRSIGDPYFPELGNTGYFVQHYALRLTLDPAVSTVVGQATIEAISAVDGLSQLSLDFVGFDVTAVAIDGGLAQFRREGKKLVIDLPQLLPAGRMFSITVAYSGLPTREPSAYAGYAQHLGLNYPGNGTIYAVAQPDGARYWFPANDHPRDKATFRFEIMVPAGLTAVANGRLVEERPSTMPDGRAATTFVWDHPYQMATYLAVVAVGDYVRLEGLSSTGIPLRHFVFPALQTQFQQIAGETAGAMVWMSEMFGPYPFDVYGYVTASIPNISMETQTMVLLSERLITQPVMLHELSHMWFGNWVSLDSWGEIWRNEGFATYLEIMWLNRNSPENFELEMAALEASVAVNSSGAPLNRLPPAQFLGFDSYYKGAVMIHKLRQTMGDDAFFRGLRLYFNRYGGGTASDAEFQAVMEEAAGRSLQSFFGNWLP